MRNFYFLKEIYQEMKKKISRKITHKRKNKKTKRTYKKKDYRSNEGMLTGVWGPALWHYLHIISFNYPINPTSNDKKYYKKMILNLKYTLPCKYCRDNLEKNLKVLPITDKDLVSRDKFSRWVFKLHELINSMLGKKSGLKYCDVRERYEHFRSRCTIEKKAPTLRVLKTFLNKTKKKEKGCTEPLYGKKSKCIIKIVPSDKRQKTFQIDKKCIKKRN
jgi:hypothetical protein